MTRQCFAVFAERDISFFFFLSHFKGLNQLTVCFCVLISYIAALKMLAVPSERDRAHCSGWPTGNVWALSWACGRIKIREALGDSEDWYTAEIKMSECAMADAQLARAHIFTHTAHLFPLRPCAERAVTLITSEGTLPKHNELPKDSADIIPSVCHVLHSLYVLITLNLPPPLVFHLPLLLHPLTQTACVLFMTT